MGHCGQPQPSADGAQRCQEIFHFCRYLDGGSGPYDRHRRFGLNMGGFTLIVMCISLYYSNSTYCVCTMHIVSCITKSGAITVCITYQQKSKCTMNFPDSKIKKKKKNSPKKKKKKKKKKS